MRRLHDVLLEALLGLYGLRVSHLCVPPRPVSTLMSETPTRGAMMRSTSYDMGVIFTCAQGGTRGMYET
jgi:hypothetical protein